MQWIDDLSVKKCVDRKAAFEAMKAVFQAMDADHAQSFPVVREAIGHADALFGFKSGFDRDSMTLGVKAGGYWPNNHQRNLANHQSTILLFNPDTGQCEAVVAGNEITALRTAAAAAVSIHALAPAKSKVLGIIGAGHQSAYQLEAALDTLPFEQVLGWNHRSGRMRHLQAIAEQHNVPFVETDLTHLGAESDCIITITSSFSPVLLDSHVVGPTHIAAMGTDTVGKQELEASLVARANCFAELPVQSAQLGECQNAVKQGDLAVGDIQCIGGVLAGRLSGRHGGEVTLFDGSGVGLQDLALAQVALEKAP